MVGNYDPCRSDYLVSATVAKVTKSENGYQPGDDIEFNSYDIHYGASGCEGYAGPSNPTQVQAGWCGNAWLDQGTTVDAPLELAAYGESLQAEFPSACPTVTTAAPTMAPTPSATVQPYDELLLVEIVTSYKHGTTGCVTTFIFDGTVQSVQDTTVGFSPGDEVYFSMDSLDAASNCLPTEPIETKPVPEAPWCGYVKLRDGTAMNTQGTLIAVDLEATSNDKCGHY